MPEDAIFPHATRELADERKRLAPGPAEAFRAFGRSVFADIRGHTAAALDKGAQRRAGGEAKA